MKPIAILAAAVAAALSLSVARAQVDKETLAEMTENMMVCMQHQAAECTEVCRTAYRSFSDAPTGDQAAIARCRTLVGPPRAEMQAQQAEQARLAEARTKARELMQTCRGDNRADCIAACREAFRAPGDASLLQACQAAQPAPIVDPNAGLSFAERVARRDEYAAYCATKLTSGQLQRGDRRVLEGCISMCRNVRVTDDRTPPEQKEAYLAQCETSYRGVKQHFGD